MSARTVPTPPSWGFQEQLTSAKLNQIQTWMLFWSSPPMFRMYQTIAQSVADSTWVQITCDSVDDDTDSGRATSTPWSYTIPPGMGGQWDFRGKTSWASNSTGYRAAAIYVNGTEVPTENIFAPGLAGGATSFALALPRSVKVNAGDVIALYGRQTSGAPLNTGVASAPDYSYLEGRLVSLANP